MKNKNSIERNDNLLTVFSLGDPNPSFIDNSEEVTRTDDFGFAVILFHIGTELLSTKKNGLDKPIFIFKKIIYLHDIIDEFYSDTFNVKAFSFLKSMSDLKKQLDLN